MSDTRTRLIKAISRLGSTKRERAAVLGITDRQLLRWETQYIPEVIIRLEETGVIRILDTPDQCPAAESVAA